MGQLLLSSLLCTEILYIHTLMFNPNTHGVLEQLNCPSVPSLCTFCYNFVLVHLLIFTVGLFLYKYIYQDFSVTQRRDDGASKWTS